MFAVAMGLAQGRAGACKITILAQMARGKMGRIDDFKELAGTYHEHTE
jgi:hypothetical protein